VAKAFSPLTLFARDGSEFSPVQNHFGFRVALQHLAFRLWPAVQHSIAARRAMPDDFIGNQGKIPIASGGFPP
jgi:hypothetical protein